MTVKREPKTLLELVEEMVKGVPQNEPHKQDTPSKQYVNEKWYKKFIAYYNLIVEENAEQANPFPYSYIIHNCFGYLAALYDYGLISHDEYIEQNKIIRKWLNETEDNNNV